jgi:ASC-1-like (ASCH) protein
MPLFWAKKEICGWLEEGVKTIEVRKGKPKSGDTATFQCGPKITRLRIIKAETGLLSEVIRHDNFKQIIPTAGTVEEARNYLRTLYSDCSGIFTAYYLSSSQN